MLFDGVPRRDPSVRRDRRAATARPRPTTASGARAASTPTCCTSSTTRGPRRRRGRAAGRSALVVFDAGARARSGWRARRRRTEGTALVSDRDARRLARDRPCRSMTDAPSRTRVRRRYRVRFDEAGPDGRLRTSVLLRYAQDLAWFHSAARGFDRAWYAERGLAWLVRAAEVEVLAGRSRWATSSSGTTQVVGWRRVWARRRTDVHRLRRRRSSPCGPHRLGAARRARRSRRGSRPSSTTSSGRRRDVPARARDARPTLRRGRRTAVRGPAAGARSAWTT